VHIFAPTHRLSYARGLCVCVYVCVLAPVPLPAPVPVSAPVLVPLPGLRAMSYEL
jgi:hypothetical protein